MFIVRPARADDLDALQKLSSEAGVGMTSLSIDRERLQEKIAFSLVSFATELDAIREEMYLFLMEDSVNGRIAGSCAIENGVGLSQPSYTFKILRLTHSSMELERYEPVEALQMVEEYRGNTEIATLFLSPGYRRDQNGQFLSRSRFLFMADFPERLDNRVFAEMRGSQDERGHSVFWESLGRHFIHMDFSKADYLSSLGSYQFIADLMPKHPVYIRLLPEAAQKVIGKTHESTRPALKLLEREGFRYEGYVDVFDAGPTVHCPLDQIRTVRDSTKDIVGKIVDSLAVESPSYLISNCRLGEYRIGRGKLYLHPEGTVHLESELARALRVETGDRVRYMPMDVRR